MSAEAVRSKQSESGQQARRQVSRLHDPAENGAAVWLRLKSAAALVDLSPGALKQHLYRRQPPDGVVRRFGRALLIHRERFLEWIESGTA